MFGRERREATHRQHVLPPQSPGYGFERVGVHKEALGFSGLSVGDEVYWYAGGDSVDTSSSGVIVELPAVDPDGIPHPDQAAVEWADDGYDIVDINNLLNAEHYNIGRGYSQAFGSRRTAGWQEEYDGTWFIRLPGDVVGFLYPSDDSEMIGTYRASAEVDREDDSRILLNVHGVSLEEGKRLVEEAAAQVTGSRKQASSLTWGHETSEQSMLGEEVWFAYSGDGFNATVTEDGSGRFAADIHTDAAGYDHVSMNETGFESVDEAKSFIEMIFQDARVASRKQAWNRASDLSDDELLNQFGNGPMDDDEFDVLILEVERRGLMDQWESRMSSRTAGKCPKCDGMGRETYETDTGSLSTQTCTACGGTGQAKESARRTAQWFTNTDRMGDSYKTTFDPSRGNEFQSDEPVARVGERPRSGDKPSKWAWEVWLPGGHPMGSGGVAPAVPEFGNEETEEEALRKAEQAMSRYAFRKASHRTAFLDTIEFKAPRHRVAGWDWDDHLNGFIAAEASREFICSCGEHVPAPGYTDCHCGKRWNVYSVQSPEGRKLISREVPVRDGVVMANRSAAGNGWSTPASDLGELSDEQLRSFVVNVNNSIDSGANVGEIMMNKRNHFIQELVSRGWRMDGRGDPYRESSHKEASDNRQHLVDIVEDAAAEYEEDTGNDPTISPDFLTQYLNVWVGAKPYAQDVDFDELKEVASDEGFGGYTW